MVFPVIELSVVPVASKNTKNGETPELRVAFTLSVSVPLVPVHDEADGGVLETETVTLCDAVPPLSTQVKV